jgi:hypothetical protein
LWRRWVTRGAARPPMRDSMISTRTCNRKNNKNYKTNMINSKVMPTNWVGTPPTRGRERSL